MLNDPRYAPVAETLPAIMPPLKAEEAERAALRLIRKFGRKKYGGPNQTRDVSIARALVFLGTFPRRCWISASCTTGHRKGWGRLVHDVSHVIFACRHPDFRPHHNLHARLEAEVAAYVVAQGWLGGSLLRAKPKPTTDEKRAAKLARIDAGLKRWNTKAKRAQTMLRKLTRQRRALARTMGLEQCK